MTVFHCWSLHMGVSYECHQACSTHVSMPQLMIMRSDIYLEIEINLFLISFHFLNKSFSEVCPACRDRWKGVEKRLSLPPPSHEIPSSSPLSSASQSLYSENATSPLAFPHYCYFSLKDWLTDERVVKYYQLSQISSHPQLRYIWNIERRDSEWFFPSFPRPMFQPKAPPSSSSAKGPPSVLAGAPFHCDNTHCI